MVLIMSDSITFTVSGDPKPKGSIKAFVVNWPYKSKFKIIELCKSIIDGQQWRPNVALTSTTKGLKEWESKIKHSALAAMAAEPEVWQGGVSVTAEFYIKRPKTHYGTGKNAGTLKDRFKAILCTKTPDLDKLVRGINDPLTGVVYKDDSQIVTIAASKRYGRKPGVKITCRKVDEIDSVNELEQLDLFE